MEYAASVQSIAFANLEEFYTNCTVYVNVEMWCFMAIEWNAQR